MRKQTVRVYATKRERGRNVDLLPSLRQDLLEWRVYAGRPGDDSLVVPGPAGALWSDSDVRNWRRRIWKPALGTVGLDQDMVPYELRHCFASLLLRDPDYTLVDVADQLGHSVAVLSSTYAHVIAELKGEPPFAADEQVRRAKAAVWGDDGEVVGL